MEEEKHYCIYCGAPATHQFKNGKWCCSKNQSSCPAKRKFLSNWLKDKWNESKDLGSNYLIETKPKHIEKIIPHQCAFCGEYAEFQLKNGKWCCHEFYAQCPALKKKNSEKIKSMYSRNKNGDVVFNNKLRKYEYTEESRKKQGWSKGKTKFDNASIKKRSETIIQKYKDKELTPTFLNKHHTKETIDKIVNRMIHFRANKILKGFKHGWYKGYWCDSSWELAFIIYNLEHDIKFERNTKGFDYTYNNKIKRFYPDFIINDTYIEIKNFNSPITLAKISCFPVNLKLKVLYKKDMTIYLSYVKEKYGKDFWKLLTDEKVIE